MREIGSEFWDIPVQDCNNDIFPDSTAWFLSGRSALQAIVRELNGCHTVSMPSWCCESMIKPFVDAGFKVSFYPVFWDKQLNQHPSFDCDVLLLIDYFGYVSECMDVSKYNGVVIRDITQSIFSSIPSDADYYFGSLRKWCGFWTGGYAWAKDGHKMNIASTNDYGYIALRKKAMDLKRAYIKDSSTNEKKYLEFFHEAEKSLDNSQIVAASGRDIEMAHHLNVDFLKSKRRSNAELLHLAFPEWLVFRELKTSDCPLFVPIIVPDGKRDRLYRHLVSNDIYCPIHWPITKYQMLSARERYLYDNEISLVCDQRYSGEDIKRIIDTIHIFMEV